MNSDGRRCCARFMSIVDFVGSMPGRSDVSINLKLNHLIIVINISPPVVFLPSIKVVYDVI